MPSFEASLDTGLWIDSLEIFVIVAYCRRRVIRGVLVVEERHDDKVDWNAGQEAGGETSGPYVAIHLPLA